MDTNSSALSTQHSTLKSKSTIYALTILVIILCTGLYGFSQFLKKEIINAVLQYQINIENPPNNIFAISTLDQKLSSGKYLPRSTRFIGKLSNEEGPVIYFNSIQTPDGKTKEFLAKSNLNINGGRQDKSGGVSAKIGKTLNRQTKSNVLGAIFKDSTNNEKARVLPRGYAIKIEVE